MWLFSLARLYILRFPNFCGGDNQIVKIKNANKRTTQVKFNIYKYYYK
jgi:hypothetical protein